MDLNNRVAKLETRSTGINQPNYLCFDTQEDYELALANGELARYKYIKVYVGVSPEDWRD